MPKDKQTKDEAHAQLAKPQKDWVSSPMRMPPQLMSRLKAMVEAKGREVGHPYHLSWVIRELLLKGVSEWEQAQS